MISGKQLIQLPPRSRHASDRQQHRAISDAAIVAALQWGRQIRQRLRRTAYFLDNASVKRAKAAGTQLEQYTGTAVIEAIDGVIVTVIRCQDSRKLRRFIR